MSGLDYPGGSVELVSTSATSEELAHAVADGLGLPNLSGLSEAQELTDEWLDLALRLEMLSDKKKAFLDSFKSEESELKKRIREITSELRALKGGQPAPVPQLEPKPEKQRELFQGCD
jgi:hypothetical protein